MPYSYKPPIDRAQRIEALTFDPADLPRQTVSGCDLCESQARQVISWVDRYGFAERFVMCEDCGLVYLDPRPTESAYRVFYERYYRELIGAWKGAPETAESMQADQRSYASHVTRLLGSANLLKKVRHAVDIGGSTGEVALLLQQEGARCLVVDPSPNELGVAARHGLQTEVGLVETWEPREQRFDLALLCRTVDHLTSVKQSLSKIRSCLTPDGILFVDAVDFESAARNTTDYRQFLKLDHCYYLSDTTMRAYLAAVGFEVVLSDITQRNLIYICRRTEGRTSPRELQRYARVTSALLRDRLVRKETRYPVDALTRVWRSVRSSVRSNQRIATFR
jgi:2-polyprenyl-3-methyl-5-hydroxy-6-metoxy-1,4-benzoquinol methylase